MIQMEDSKLGKVKLVTVTEARQNISSIMQDFGIHYVITKNSKPVRMIVDYEAFTENKNLPNKSEEPTQTEITPKEVVSQETKTKKSEKPSISNKNYTLGQNEDPKPVLKTKKTKFPDFFNQHEKQDEKTEASLPTPDATVENVETRLHSTEVTNQVWETEKTQADNEDWIIEADNEKTTRDIKEETQPLDEISNNPEKEAYFKRFRKLYEPIAKPKFNTFESDYWKQEPVSEETGPSDSVLKTLSSTEEEEIKMEIKKETKRETSPSSTNPTDPPSIEDILKALEEEKI